MKDLSLNEIVEKFAGSRFVFEQFRFDYCCGGRQTLAHVCAKRGIPVDEVIDEINKRALRKEDMISFSEWPLDLLVDYIEKKHHRYITDTWEHITAKLDRLVYRHGAENPFLEKLRDVFAQVATGLLAHMKKEEGELFPLVRMLVNAQREGKTGMVAAELVIAQVKVLEGEHEEEGGRMHELAEMTDNFTPPPQACATWQYTYEKLAEFEKDLHLHIYLENAILFPGAVQLARIVHAEPQSCSIVI